jgi:hypothetical protein
MSADVPSAPSEQRLRDVLRAQGWSGSDLICLDHAWASQARIGEDLASFLVRNEVLKPGASAVLGLPWGDDLLATGSADLFRSGGLGRLRRLIGDQADDAADAETLEGPTPASIRDVTSHETTPVSRRSFLVPARRPPSDEAARAPAGEPAPAMCVLVPGQILGRCLITGRIAQGSYGVVYRGLHRTLNVAVAVKVLHPDLLDRDAAGSQFRTEAMLLARLNHPNIVRLWDFDDTVIPPYLVLEYVEGQNVADLIRRDGALPPATAVRVAQQVVDGLEAASYLGIVHRDVKPANILLTRDGQAKLADLGLAAVAGRTRPDAPVVMAGTVAYLAPEQASGSSAADLRADVYSLGATLYHMLTGRLPFDGRSALDVLLKHAREPVVPPDALSPAVSPALSAVVVRMLAKDPADRFATYGQLRETLRAATG